ncbi:MAG: manganese/zinc/iron transport system substrate-binding protein [Bacteroidia bacterium]|jgi:manganese/zinc/iron transport system substrate-binding protein
MKICSSSYVILIAFLILHSSCADQKQGNNKPTIVATTSIIADVVRNLGGDSVNVVSLMGPGVDPHLYKASSGDVTLLRDGNLVVYNGLHLEGKMSEILEKLSKTNAVVALSDGMDAKAFRVINLEAHVYDPHVWFDPIIWAQGVKHLSVTMQKEFPQFKSYIAINEQRYLAEIDSVHTVCMNLVASLPIEKRILITSHDAFSYFGQRYNFEVRGLQGISTLSESGLKDVTDMVNYIINNKVKAVFIENSVPQKALKSVLEGCQEKGNEVRIGGELFSDALGADRTPEGTYLGMLHYNVSTVVSALK